MDTFTHVPPGFRFHPTDEELVDYYLRKKVASRKIDLDVIKDVDLYKIEPWDLQELCKIGTEEQSEWYFFSHKDKKYPTGTRTNRATKAGFWKATGRDKAIYAKHCLVGMRKTLVFYKGRAPNGQKSDWIMHEYRLETNENAAPQEEGWVVCRVFKKRITTVRKMGDDSPCWYDDQMSFMSEMSSPSHLSLPYAHYHQRPYPCKQELDHQLQYNNLQHDPSFLQLPQLESPKAPSMSCSPLTPYNFDQQSNNISSLHGYNQHQHIGSSAYEQDHDGDQTIVEQVTDWRVLDKFVASQLSQEDAQKESNYSDGDAGSGFELMTSPLVNSSDKQELGTDNPSTSSSSCPIDLWK